MSKITNKNKGNKNQGNNNLRIFNCRIKSFEPYGLNKFRNLLSPIPCDCGCGGYAEPIFEDIGDLYGFCYSVLAEEECECCAIFAHGLDGKMHAIVKMDEYEGEYDYEQPYNPDENPIHFLGIKETDMEFFAEIDAELGLHCYGLLIENVGGRWTIVTE